MDRKAVAEWLDSVTSGHSISNANKLTELEQFGFSIKDNGDKLTISLGDRSSDLWLSSWEDDFNSLKHQAMSRGIGFVVIREHDQDEDRVEYRYCKTDKLVQTYDVNGYPKTKTPFYAVLYTNKDQVHTGFGGYIWDTEFHREQRSYDGNSLASAICRVLDGKDESRAIGRGFAFSERIRQIAGN